MRINWFNIGNVLRSWLAHDKWETSSELSKGQRLLLRSHHPSLALPKAQAVMPRKLFRNLLTAHLCYQVCFSVKPAWAILSQWFFSGAKKNHYLSIFWLLNKAVFLQYGRPGFDPWVREIPWRKTWKPTPVFLLGEFCGQRNLVGYSPWDCKESDMTEQPTLFTFKQGY